MADTNTNVINALNGNIDPWCTTNMRILRRRNLNIMTMTMPIKIARSDDCSELFCLRALSFRQQLFRDAWQGARA